jgi:hypothetical protein
VYYDNGGILLLYFFYGIEAVSPDFIVITGINNLGYSANSFSLYSERASIALFLTSSSNDMIALFLLT